MRTAFYTVGTILATLANLPSAMELDSNTGTVLDSNTVAQSEAEAPADISLAVDAAAEFGVFDLHWGNKCRGLQD